MWDSSSDVYVHCRMVVRGRWFASVYGKEKAIGGDSFENILDVMVIPKFHGVWCSTYTDEFYFW